MLICPVAPLDGLFDPNHMPQLLYITKQEFGAERVDRPLHSHDDICEILLVFRGMGIYRCGTQTYAIEEGDLIFYTPGSTHEVSTSLDREIGTYCFGLTGFVRPGLPNNCIVPPDSAIIRASGTRFDCLHAMAEQLYQDLDAHTLPDPCTGVLLAGFLSLALSVESNVPRHSRSSVEYQIAERVQNYIDAHFTEPLTLESISETLRCSAPYISHVFKDVIGYSPIQYMTRCRIGLAQTFLISSDYTSTQIATLVGYDNTNYFNTVFTKTVGLSPIKYRRKYLDAMRGNRTQ